MCEFSGCCMEEEMLQVPPGEEKRERRSISLWLKDVSLMDFRVLCQVGRFL